MALVKNVPFIVRSMQEHQHNLYDNLDESSKKLLQSLMEKLIPGQNELDAKAEKNDEANSYPETAGKPANQSVTQA